MSTGLALTARLKVAAYVLIAAVLWLVLPLHLLPALLAGLLVYSLVTTLAPVLQRRVPGVHAHWLVVALLAIFVVGLFTLAIGAAVAFLNSENGNPTVFFERLAPLIERAHAQLPAFIVDRLPDDSREMRTAVMDWLGEHTAELQVAGKQAVRRRRDSSKRVVYRSQGVGAQRKPRDLLNSRGQRAKSKIKRSPGICVFVSTKPPCYLPLPRKHFVSFKG